VEKEEEKRITQNAYRQMCSMVFKNKATGDTSTLLDLCGKCGYEGLGVVARVAFCDAPLPDFNIELNNVLQIVHSLGLGTLYRTDSKKALIFFWTLEFMSVTGEQYKSSEDPIARNMILFDAMNRPGFLYELNEREESYLQKVMSADNYGFVFEQVRAGSLQFERVFRQECTPVELQILENDMIQLYSLVVEKVVESLLPTVDMPSIFDFTNFVCCLHGIDARNLFAITAFESVYSALDNPYKSVERIVDDEKSVRRRLEMEAETATDAIVQKLFVVLPDPNAIMDNGRALVMLRCLGTELGRTLAGITMSIITQANRIYGDQSIRFASRECSSEDFLIDFCSAVSGDDNEIRRKYLEFCVNRKVFEFNEYDETEVDRLISEVTTTRLVYESACLQAIGL
jgi:hypothetical protein